MKRCHRLGFSVFAAMIASAQQSPVPYADADGPTFAAHPDADTWPGSYQSIRSADFRNLRLPRVLAGDEAMRLRNGHYEHNEPFDQSSVDLDSVRYLTAEGFALVVYSWFAAGGSSSSGDYAALFKVSNGRLQSLQSISWSTHSAGPRPTWSFDPKTNTVVIRSDHCRPGDAHISAVDVVTYRWNGTLSSRPALPQSCSLGKPLSD